MSKKSRAGFTLIELLVVMVVLSVLATVAIPTFTRWYPNYRLRTAAREIYSTFQTARMAAIKTGNASTFGAVTFDTGNKTYMAFIDEDDNWVPTGTERILKQVTLPDDVDYNDITLASDRTRFNSRGLVTGGTGYVKLVNDNGRTQKITVWTAGNIEID